MTDNEITKIIYKLDEVEQDCRTNEMKIKRLREGLMKIMHMTEQQLRQTP
jgi:hypothetical protein